LFFALFLVLGLSLFPLDSEKRFIYFFCLPCSLIPSIVGFSNTKKKREREKKKERKTRREKKNMPQLQAHKSGH